jgi:hypothetical protein
MMLQRNEHGKSNEQLFYSEGGYQSARPKSETKSFHIGKPLNSNSAEFESIGHAGQFRNFSSSEFTGGAGTVRCCRLDSPPSGGEISNRRGWEASLHCPRQFGALSIEMPSSESRPAKSSRRA